MESGGSVLWRAGLWDLLLLRNHQLKVTRFFYRTKTATQVCSKWAGLLVGMATRKHLLCVCVCVEIVKPAAVLLMTQQRSDAVGGFLKVCFYRLLLQHPHTHTEIPPPPGWPPSAADQGIPKQRCVAVGDTSAVAVVTRLTHTFRPVYCVSSAAPQNSPTHTVHYWTSDTRDV